MKKFFLATLLVFLSLPVFAQNISGVLAPSAARTSTFTSPDQDNPQWRGVSIILDVTAYTSGTWTVHIEGKDIASGKYYTLLTGAAVNSTGTNVYRIYPSLANVANVSASSTLPRTWRVRVVGASTPSATFSVGVNLDL